MLLENNSYPQDVRVRAEAESLVASGRQVVVVAPRGPRQARRQWIKGVEVRRYWSREADGGGISGFVREYLIATVALHFAAVRELIRGAHILHLHNPPDLLFSAGALFRLAGRQVIFDHHDLFPETVEAKFGSGLPSRLASCAERLTFASATHVLATNESYAEIAHMRGHKSPDAVTIVRNAPPVSWTQTPLSIRPHALCRVELVYVGAVSTQDGVAALAKVLALVRSRGLDPVLTIVGDGDARAEVESELSQYGVGDTVTITGWVPHEEVAHILQRADICVDPAPGSEVNHRSTMIKIAEYMAAGKPVVAYDLLETRRTTASAAMLVAPGDVERFAENIVSLAHDPALRLQFAGAARQRAQQLAWPHSEEALLSAYARVEALGTAAGS